MNNLISAVYDHNRFKIINESESGITLNELTGNNFNKGIYVVTFDRPFNRNALGPFLIEEVNSKLKQFESDSNVRVLIIRSLVNGVFCSGSDLKERITMSTLEAVYFLCQRHV